MHESANPAEPVREIKKHQRSGSSAELLQPEIKKSLQMIRALLCLNSAAFKKRKELKHEMIHVGAG